MEPLSPVKTSEPPVAQPVGETKTKKKKSRRSNYQRRDKPSQSYAELITMAIKESPSGRLTLREIQAHMSATYECFRGSYVGWKNSVRHNLSANPCFVKILRDSAKPQAKDNFWTLNPDFPLSRKQGIKEEPSDKDQVPRTPSPSQTPKSGAAPKEGDVTEESSAAKCPGSPDIPTSRTGLPSSDKGLLSMQSSPVSSSHTELPNSTISSSNPPSDEWELLQDLYIPDSDIDLSLYNDDCTSYTKQSSHSSGLDTPRHHPYSSKESSSNFNGHSSSSGWRYNLPYNAGAQMRVPGHASLTHPAKMRIKSEYRSVSRYHPYGQNHQVSYHSSSSQDWVNYTSSRHELSHHSQMRYLDDSRVVPSFAGSDSLLVSAIRSSLGLDLDEMALCAIEHSVRVLDLTRPCDYMSA